MQFFFCKLMFDISLFNELDFIQSLICSPKKKDEREREMEGGTTKAKEGGQV